MDPAPRRNSTLRSLLPYLWEFRGRASLALVLLVLADLAVVVVPWFLKRAVDELGPGHALLVLPAGLLVGYGAMRFAGTFLGELRDVVFELATLRAARRVALKVFRHLHDLDLAFHLERQTGGLSRDIERGISGISFLLRFMLFNIIPTLLEIAMVATILLAKYDWHFAAIAFVAVALYVFFSVMVSEWRTKYVRAANQLDSRANTRAIDSLLNYETVKLFGNENHEAAEYDRFLQDWEKAQAQNRVSLAGLNLGQ
jgi:ATP-binding cassette subfamily B protein